MKRGIGILGWLVAIAVAYGASQLVLGIRFGGDSEAVMDRAIAEARKISASPTSSSFQTAAQVLSSNINTATAMDQKKGRQYLGDRLLSTARSKTST